MKHAIAKGAALLAAVGLLAAPSAALALDNPQKGSTEITAKVPSEYLLTVPSKVEISFEAESTPLPAIGVTGNVAVGETVTVTADLNGGELTGDRDTKRIPFALNDETGAAFTQAVWDEDDLRLGFDDADRIVEQRLSVDIAKDVWDHAQAGAYTGRITFTAELR